MPRHLLACNALEGLRVAVAQVCGWTDSTTALQWVKGQPLQWPTWVRNRVAMVQELALQWNITWKHVPGKQNQADLASRGTPVDQVKSSLWLHGPSRLDDRTQWPQETEFVVNETSVKKTEAKERPEWYQRLLKWT